MGLKGYKESKKEVFTKRGFVKSSKGEESSGLKAIQQPEKTN